MHELVKLYINDDEDLIAEEDQVWCLVDPNAMDAPRTMCNGEVFGYGEGAADGPTKTVKRGGITCPDCLVKIKRIKSLKL